MQVPVTIPTELREIKLATYQKYEAIRKDSEDSEFLLHKAIQIFCNCDLDVVSHMKQKDVNEINSILIALFKKVPKLIQRFELNGIEYGFIPNLDDMTSGEYMDLDTYISDWDDMHKAMAVLYRPIIKKQDKKYLIEPYKGTDGHSELMKQMPLDVAFSAYLFFWTLGKDLLKSTIAYLTEANNLANLANLPALVKDGDGMLQLIHSLEATFESTMKLPSLMSTNA